MGAGARRRASKGHARAARQNQPLAGRFGDEMMLPRGNILALILLTGCASGNSKDHFGLIDSIDLEHPASVDAHQFKSSADVTVARVGDFVGGHDMHRIAHVVRGAGSWVSYQVKVVPGKPTTIEIEEIDGRERH